MYQTARSQRNFTKPLKVPQIERGQYIQPLYNMETKKLKYIVHDRATKQQVLSVKWFARHGIKGGMVIANKFQLTKNKTTLRAEAELIKLKKSNLSKKQRDMVLEALGI